MSIRAAVLALVTTLLFAGAPLAASAAPGGVHSAPLGRPALHAPVLRPMLPAISGPHGTAAEPADHASHPATAPHSVAPQVEFPLRRPVLPWWFHRRHLAAPEPPLV